MNPTRSEAFIARLKDQFRKKKVSASRGQGASSVEERWHPPAADEDYWLPIRANSNTRIDTLPGAQNLGEIDDAVYFRNKLFVALNFPKNYFSSEDMQVTRASLSVQNVQFARMIERLQSHIEDGLMQMVEFHLYKMGFPQESYEDIKIKLTPPSEWREQQRAELISGRVNNANALKSSLLYSDFDILTKIMKHGENEAKEMLSRLSLQKLKELKMQIVAQNPQLIGVGVPAEDETEIGAESGGPNPMLAPDNAPPPEGGQAPEGVATPPQEGQPTGQPNAQPLPDPTGEELKKYDLQIQTYSREQDVEDIDYSSQER
jgi:hypothetical protein